MSKATHSGYLGTPLLVLIAFAAPTETQLSAQTQTVVSSEYPHWGTVSGSYLDTHGSDDVYEAITEAETSGTPRESFLASEVTVSDWKVKDVRHESIDKQYETNFSTPLAKYVRPPNGARPGVAEAPNGVAVRRAGCACRAATAERDTARKAAIIGSLRSSRARVD